MFTVVLPPHVPHGLRERMRCMFRSKSPDIQIEQVGGVRFQTLTPGKIKYNWENIDEICRRGYILAPEEVFLPEELRRRLFHADELRWELLVSCAQTWARANSRRLSEIVFAVVDPDGRYLNTVRTLIRTCLTVKVVTHATGRYEELFEEIMEECGAAIVVTSDLLACEGCTALLAPQGLSGWDRAGVLPPVFSGGAVEAGGPLFVVTQPQIENPFGEALPGEINPTDFLGALMQLGGYRPDFKCRVESVCMNGSPRRIGGVAAREWFSGEKIYQYSEV